MTDWEIWACAAKLLKDHGEFAGSMQAALRADDLLEKGDVLGYGVWIRIMACIPKFGLLVDEGETRH